VGLFVSANLTKGGVSWPGSAPDPASQAAELRSLTLFAQRVSGCRPNGARYKAPGPIGGLDQRVEVGTDRHALIAFRAFIGGFQRVDFSFIKQADLIGRQLLATGGIPLGQRLFQSLFPQTEAAAFPIQDLEAIPASITENIQLL